MTPELYFFPVIIGIIRIEYISFDGIELVLSEYFNINL